MNTNLDQPIFRDFGLAGQVAANKMNRVLKKLDKSIALFYNEEAKQFTVLNSNQLTEEAIKRVLNKHKFAQYKPNLLARIGNDGNWTITLLPKETKALEEEHAAHGQVAAISNLNASAVAIPEKPPHSALFTFAPHIATPAPTIDKQSWESGDNREYAAHILAHYAQSPCIDREQIPDDLLDEFCDLLISPELKLDKEKYNLTREALAMLLTIPPGRDLLQQHKLLDTKVTMGLHNDLTKETSFVPAENKIFFDFKALYSIIYKDNKKISYGNPQTNSKSLAIIIGHELIHALHYHENRTMFMDDVITKNENFTTGEELQTIAALLENGKKYLITSTISENSLRLFFGEYMRITHSGIFKKGERKDLLNLIQLCCSMKKIRLNRGEGKGKIEEDMAKFFNEKLQKIPKNQRTNQYLEQLDNFINDSDSPVTWALSYNMEELVFPLLENDLKKDGESIINLEVYVEKKLKNGEDKHQIEKYILELFHTDPQKIPKHKLCSAFDLAMKHDMQELALFLIKNGIDLNDPNNKKHMYKIFDFAIKHNEAEVVIFLIKSGIDLNDPNNKECLYQILGHSDPQVYKKFIPHLPPNIVMSMETPDATTNAWLTACPFIIRNIANEDYILSKLLDPNCSLLTYNLIITTHADNEKIILPYLEKEKNRLILDKVSLRLKNNKEIVKAAIKTDPRCILHAGEELKNSKAFLIEAIQIDPHVVDFLNKSQNSAAIIKAAIKSYPKALKYASKKLRNNEDFIKELIEINPQAIRYASKKLRNNENFIKKLIETNPEIESFLKNYRNS